MVTTHAVNGSRSNIESSPEAEIEATPSTGSSRHAPPFGRKNASTKQMQAEMAKRKVLEASSPLNKGH